jgi:predicted dehydrogenase
MTVNVAIVGLGKMGLLHASILTALPDVRLVAVCEKKFWLRRFSQKAFNGVAVEADLRGLRGLDLDAVYVTTPVSSHYEIVKAIYEDNIACHIFVEKPLASSYTESTELFQLADTNPGVAMVGYNRRFAVTFAKAKEILDGDLLGEVLFFKSYAYSSDFLGAKRNRSRSEARGGVLRDLGCHAIDLALWFVGELEVQSSPVNLLAQGSHEDSVTCQMRTAAGAEGTFEASWAMETYRLPEVGMQIRGTRGILSVNEDKVELARDNGDAHTWYRHDLNDQVPFFLGSADYFREDQAFIQAILGKKPALSDFQSASKVTRVIDQILALTGEKARETKTASGR